MKLRLTSLLLALCLVLSACGGTSGSSSSGASLSGSEDGTIDFPTELKEDEKILGTVFGKEIPYTDYRIYLDLEDRAYRDSLRLEMALNSLLETKLEELGEPVSEDDFEAFAAETYYNEMLSYPRLIDEIDAAQKFTGLMSDSMDMAIYETYRQSYYIEKLGDIFYSEYEAANPAEEGTDDTEYSYEAYQYANEKLSEIADDFYSRITIPDDDALLCSIDGSEIKLEERHKAYLILEIARNRINIVNSILIGEGLAAKLESEGQTVDLTEFEETYRNYLSQLAEEEDFSSSYGKHLEEMGVTMGQLLESTYRSVETIGGYNEAYITYLTGKYEQLPENEKPDSFEEYYESEYSSLCAECLAENPMG